MMESSDGRLVELEEGLRGVYVSSWSLFKTKLQRLIVL